MDVNDLRRGLLMQMAQGGKQLEIITIQNSTHLGDAIAGHFNQYADQTGINYFVRLSPYNSSLSMLATAIYENGVIYEYCLRKRATGDYSYTPTTNVYAIDVEAGDKYAKIVVEEES